MVDRTPQQFPDGDPDGTTDNTVAIQAAIDAWQPGDQVVLSGGTFRTSGVLKIPHDGLIVRGDASVRALSGFVGATMIKVTGTGVLFDADGLEVDQADVIASGDSIRAAGAVGLQLLNLRSRETQRSFLLIADGTTDLLVAGCDHHGRGYGVLAPDPSGLTRLAFRDSTFEHPGSGPSGDGIEINCPSFGASEVTVTGCVAKGYVGEASNQGIGFGFARVTDGRIIGCRAIGCEGDGFHFEHGSDRWLCADLLAIDIGRHDPAGGNGSGLIAYDSDDVRVILVTARDCGFHGIAMSGQGWDEATPSERRLNGLIERCTVDGSRRDGIHMTAQQDFRIDRNRVRNPSLGNPDQFAGIHVGRQGGTSLENVAGTGSGNVVELSGDSTPLAPIFVREKSLDVIIDGVAGSEGRLTEAGERRATEAKTLLALELA